MDSRILVPFKAINLTSKTHRFDTFQHKPEKYIMQYVTSCYNFSL